MAAARGAPRPGLFHKSLWRGRRALQAAPVVYRKFRRRVPARSASMGPMKLRNSVPQIAPVEIILLTSARVHPKIGTDDAARRNAVGPGKNNKGPKLIIRGKRGDQGPGQTGRNGSRHQATGLSTATSDCGTPSAPAPVSVRVLGTEHGVRIPGRFGLRYVAEAPPL